MRGGVNVYGYVGGNPVGWIDPYGLCLTPFQIDLIAAGLGGGVAGFFFGGGPWGFVVGAGVSVGLTAAVDAFGLDDAAQVGVGAAAGGVTPGGGFSRSGAVSAAMSTALASGANGPMGGVAAAGLGGLMGTILAEAVPGKKISGDARFFNPLKSGISGAAGALVEGGMKELLQPLKCTDDEGGGRRCHL